MADDTIIDAEPTPLRLSDDETRILELHDRLQQLQLEIALLTAQRDYEPYSSPSSPQTVESAQQELLHSRAQYVLRNTAIDAVLSANPILQAIHNGTNASPIEKDLQPLVSTRDSLSSTLARQSNSYLSHSTESFAAETAALALQRENVDRAAELLRLAAEVKSRRRRDVMGDRETREEMAGLEARLAQSRRRYRVAKGVASAVVVGSGVEWAEDEKLRNVVLDDEDLEEEDNW